MTGWKRQRAPSPQPGTTTDFSSQFPGPLDRQSQNFASQISVLARVRLTANMGDLREILGIQAPKQSTGPILPGAKSKSSQGPPPMEPRQKKPRTCLFDFQLLSFLAIMM